MEDIVFVVIGLMALVAFIWLLCLPGSIAKKKNHPYASGIGILGVIGGLFFFIGWIVAFIWAFILPTESVETLRKVKANPDVADELSKLKNLEIEGVLTSDEFNFKKSQLIGPITN